MSEFVLNPAAKIEKVEHQDPEIQVYLVDDFLKNPEQLVDYASSKAYFGNVGDDRTAYPGIRDRLPRPYERLKGEMIERIYGVSNPLMHRSMLSLTTLEPQQLSPSQRIPHVDAFGDNQYAAVHYLCGAPHGGTAIYRYLPRNKVRLRTRDRQIVEEMVQQVKDDPEQHSGYLAGDTKYYKQELVVEAKFNRLVLYPANLLHCALLTSPASLEKDVTRGRLTVASFFQLDPEMRRGDNGHSDVAGVT